MVIKGRSTPPTRLRPLQDQNAAYDIRREGVYVKKSVVVSEFSFGSKFVQIWNHQSFDGARHVRIAANKTTKAVASLLDQNFLNKETKWSLEGALQKSIWDLIPNLCKNHYYMGV